MSFSSSLFFLPWIKTNEVQRKENDSYLGNKIKINQLKQDKDQISIRKNNQNKYLIKPIESESQSDTEILKANAIIKRQNIIQYIQSQKSHQRKIQDILKKNNALLNKKLKLKRIKTKVSESFQQEIKWNKHQFNFKNYGQLNKIYQFFSYKVVQESITNFLDQSNKAHNYKNIILFEGSEKTGKRTLIFHCLNEIQLKQNLQLFYLQNKELNHSKIKINFDNFCRHLETIEFKESQKHIYVIGGFNKFMSNCFHRKQFKQFRKILRENLNILIIGIDIKFIKSIKYKLHDHIKTILINKSLLKSHFKDALDNQLKNQTSNIKMNLPSPLKNFLCCKLQQMNQLSFDYLQEFIKYILKCKNETQNNQIIVKRQLIESYINLFKKEAKKIDLIKLSLHEKIIIVGCYVSLKEKEGVSIDKKTILDQYFWVCTSLNIAPKIIKEIQNILKLLHSYGTLKRLKSTQNYLLNLDLHQIETAFENQKVFHKFFINLL